MKDLWVLRESSEDFSESFWRLLGVSLVFCRNTLETFRHPLKTSRSLLKAFWSHWSSLSYTTSLGLSISFTIETKSTTIRAGLLCFLPTSSKPNLLYLSRNHFYHVGIFWKYQLVWIIKLYKKKNNKKYEPIQITCTILSTDQTGCHNKT